MEWPGRAPRAPTRPLRANSHPSEPAREPEPELEFDSDSDSDADADCACDDCLVRYIQADRESLAGLGMGMGMGIGFGFGFFPSKPIKDHEKAGEVRKRTDRWDERDANFSECQFAQNACLAWRSWRTGGGGGKEERCGGWSWWTWIATASVHRSSRRAPFLLGRACDTAGGPREIHGRIGRGWGFMRPIFFLP